MKKLLFVLASLACLFVIAVVLAWWNLPAVGSYVLSRAAQGQVEIGRFNFSYAGGVLRVDMGDVRAKGKVTGSAREVHVALNLKKGLYFNHVAVSDFSLTIPPESKDKKKFSIIPTDLLEARNGVVTYGKEKFTVKELVAEHLRKGQPFRFRGEVLNDRWFAAIKVDAEGLVRGSYAAVKGKASVTRMDMAQWTEDMGGIVDGEGSFSYENKKFSLESTFAVTDYVLRIKELKEPRFREVLKGSVVVTADRKTIEVHAKDVMYKGAPFRVDVWLANLDIAKVEVSSGFLDMEDFRHHVDLDKVEKGASAVWDYVKGGRVGIERIRFTDKGESDVTLRVKEMYGAYKTWNVNGVEGDLRIDDRKFTFSGMKGVCAGSSFKDVSGVYTYSDKKFKVSASYAVDLKDVAPMVETDAFSLKGGLTAGTVSIDGKMGGPVDYRGKGTVTDGEALWKTLPLTLNGAFSFAKTAITFEPLKVTQGATDVIVTGSWSPEQLGLRLRGSLDVAHAERLAPLPVKAEGIAVIDVGIDRKDGNLKVYGALDMKDLFYDVPNVMTKAKGIANSAHFDISQEKDLTHITRLTYNLGAIDADVKGDVRKDRIMDLDVSLKIDGFEKVAEIFSVSEAVAKGDADAVMSLRGLDLKARTISSIKGHVNVNNGLVRVPGFSKPFKEIRLKADFTGNAFDIQVDRLVCGATVVSKGSLRSEGLASPRFSLSLVTDNLDFNDFKGKSTFTIDPIPPDSMLARASGTLAMTAKKVRMGALSGENLEIRGVIADRKINFSEFKTDILGGHAALQGNADFSGREPKFFMSGKLDRIESSNIFTTLDSKDHLMQGKWLAHGSLSAQGRNTEGLLRSMGGNLTLYSQNGVIKKWTLLSRVLGLLNVYDLLRGKVDLAAEGLAYTRMGASFLAKDGVFRTDNFLIDSPSMLITGAGDVDIAKGEIDGDITVSPLVTIDSIVDRIPLVGRLIGKKKGGFLYVSYAVKGPLTDPAVTVRFVDTIGGKAIDLIRNILTLPKEVFE